MKKITTSKKNGAKKPPDKTVKKVDKKVDAKNAKEKIAKVKV